MNHQLLQYINFARDRKMNDQDIRDNLVAAGWNARQVEAALKAGDKDLLMPPPPPTSDSETMAASGLSRSQRNEPIAVIQQRTTRGLEYIIMFLAMGVTAISLGALLHSLVDSGYGYSGGSSDGFMAFASSALIVALPIFAVLFLRLKKAEATETGIRHDPSRRHAVQLTLIVAFLWGLYRLVTYIYSLINGRAENFMGSNISDPLGNLLHTLITVGIAGGIFAYYWADEHRKDQK